MCSTAMINFPCLCCYWNGTIHPMQGHNSLKTKCICFFSFCGKLWRAYKHTITTKYWTETLLIKWAHLGIHNKRYLHVRPIIRVPPFRVLRHFICVILFLMHSRGIFLIEKYWIFWKFIMFHWWDETRRNRIILI